MKALGLGISGGRYSNVYEKKLADFNSRRLLVSEKLRKRCLQNRALSGEEGKTYIK